MLGIGAAWYEREHLALGVPYPPVAERFERLEEAIQICEQMWSDNDGPYQGKHYQLAETICVPQPLQSPRPPILIGGGGEKKTLRLVARYADACNLFGSSVEDVRRKLDVLKGHCDAEGRDYDAIEKTAQIRFDLGDGGENVSQVIENLHQLAELGFTVGHGSLINVSKPGQLDLLAEKVIPAVAKF
jgi:alkanesulfonate monooxygenase SsuD/methylene tetrahydromethanopterin reductase-like flavin-dependent oxidoreductase (luciferase family)